VEFDDSADSSGDIVPTVFVGFDLFLGTLVTRQTRGVAEHFQGLRTDAVPQAWRFGSHHAQALDGRLSQRVTAMFALLDEFADDALSQQRRHHVQSDVVCDVVHQLECQPHLPGFPHQ